MDLDNDEIAYTRYFRELQAYKNTENLGDMIHPDSEFAEDVETLREYFRLSFNRKVSKDRELK